MATEAPFALKIGQLAAAADLSGKQYYFVKLNSSGQVAACTASTDAPIGVLQNKPTTNQAAEVCVIGVTKISADVLVTAGNAIGPSADGQAEPKTVGTTAGYAVGYLLTGGAAGVTVTAVVDCASPNLSA